MKKILSGSYYIVSLLGVLFVVGSFLFATNETHFRKGEIAGHQQITPQSITQVDEMTKEYIFSGEQFTGKNICLAFYLAEHFLYHRANFPGDIKNGDADFSASPFFHPILMFWFPKDLLYLIHAPSAPTVYPSVVVVPAAMDPNGPPLTVLKKYHLPPISCHPVYI